MARPLRPQWRMRTMVRRRHRTWVASMVFATLGWGVWWVTIFVHRFWPEFTVDLFWPSTIAGTLAAIGFALAFFSIRAKRIWVLLALVPMFANGSWLLVPTLLDERWYGRIEPVPETADTQRKGETTVAQAEYPNDAAGQAAMDLAREAGYAVRLSADEESGEWTCVCSKTMLATYDGVVAAKRESDDLVSHLDKCSTDGWGTFGHLD